MKVRPIKHLKKIKKLAKLMQTKLIRTRQKMIKSTVAMLKLPRTKKKRKMMTSPNRLERTHLDFSLKCLKLIAWASKF